MPLAHFFAAFAAGIIVLFSWLAIGRGLGGALRLPQRIVRNPALLACIGMAAFTVLGGVLMLLRIVGPALLGALTLIAACSLPLWYFRRRRVLLARARIHPLQLVLIGILAAGLYTLSISDTTVNAGDDKLAYILFPKQILQSGTLLDPFNMRRLGTYGGQQFLQAQIIATTRIFLGPHAYTLFAARPHVLEHCLATLLAAVMIFRLARNSSLRSPAAIWLAILPAAAFLLAPLPRANTHSEVTGMLLLLALAQLLPQLAKNKICRGVVPVTALVAACISSFRMNFLAAAALAPAFACLHRPHALKKIAGRGLPVLGLLTVALAPFAIVLQQSSGTLFYPLFKGNQQSSAFLDLALSVPAHLRWMFACLLYPRIFILLLPLVFAIRLRRWRDFVPLYGAAILMAAAVAWSYTNCEPADIDRYCAPPLFAAAFGTLAVSLRRWRLLSVADRIAIAILLVSIPWIANHQYSGLFRSTYPIALLLIPLLAPCVGIRKIKFELPIGGGLLAILTWSDLQAAQAIFDNTSLLLAGFSFAAMLWILFAARSILLRFAAGISALAALVLITIAITSHYGFEIASPLAYLFVGAVVLTWMISRSKYPKTLPGKSLAAAGFGLAVYFAFINGPFLRDAFLPTFPLPSHSFQNVQRDETLQESYAHAQSLVPPGQTIFVILPDPYLLDFHRNILLTADGCLQYVSPPPGIPVADNPSELHAYFQGQNIHYLLLPAILHLAEIQPPPLGQAFLTLAQSQPAILSTPNLLLIDLNASR